MIAGISDVIVYLQRPKPMMLCLLVVLTLFSPAQSQTVTGPLSRAPAERLLSVASDYSCSPRKTCSRTVRSCDEAYWLLRNCSWGSKLDRDGDGVPCENLCGSRRRR